MQCTWALFLGLYCPFLYPQRVFIHKYVWLLYFLEISWPYAEMVSGTCGFCWKHDVWMQRVYRICDISWGWKVAFLYQTRLNNLAVVAIFSSLQWRVAVLCTDYRKMLLFSSPAALATTLAATERKNLMTENMDKEEKVNFKPPWSKLGATKIFRGTNDN